MRVAVADAGADLDAVGRLLDPLQLAHAAEIDHRVEPAHLLGHPQADIGAAGDDGGAGLGQKHVRERVDGGRGEEAAAAVADRRASRRRAARAAAPASSAAAASIASRARVGGVRSAAPRGRSGRSRCSGRDCRRARRRSPPRRAARRPCRVSANIDMTKPGVQKPHCEPWQSTIACCTGCRRAVGGLQILDGEQLAAVERRHELDAGIDGAVVEPRRRCGLATTTVQAPQSPSAQPSLVPVRRRASRSQSSTVWVGSTRSSSTSSWPSRKRTLSRMAVHRTPLARQAPCRQLPR